MQGDNPAFFFGLKCQGKIFNYIFIQNNLSEFKFLTKL